MADHSSLAEQAAALYAPRPHHILPFVGSAFEGKRPELIRALVVGINTYISPEDWNPEKGWPSPDWFPRWFTKVEHRYGKRVRAESLTLLRALIGGPLTGMNVDWPESFYATNAIKVHVPEAIGKRANQITDAMLEEHVPTWWAELDLLAAHDVLPHVIMIFGWRFWGGACTSFRPPRAESYRHLRVLTYEQFPGPWQPSFRLLQLGSASAEQTTLLVRLRHPSARTKVGSAKSLLAQGDLGTITLGTSHWTENDRPSDADARNYSEGDEFIYRGHKYVIQNGACRRV